MPMYQLRREKRVPFEIVVEAPTIEAAEAAAHDNFDKWEEGHAYWRDTDSIELEAGEGDPAIVVHVDEDGDDE